jgi:hypothetical protein
MESAWLNGDYWIAILSRKSYVLHKGWEVVGVAGVESMLSVLLLLLY